MDVVVDGVWRRGDGDEAGREVMCCALTAKAMGADKAPFVVLCDMHGDTVEVSYVSIVDKSECPHGHVLLSPALARFVARGSTIHMRSPRSEDVAKEITLRVPPHALLYASTPRTRDTLAALLAETRVVRGSELSVHWTEPGGAGSRVDVLDVGVSGDAEVGVVGVLTRVHVAMNDDDDGGGSDDANATVVVDAAAWVERVCADMRGARPCVERIVHEATLALCMPQHATRARPGARGVLLTGAPGVGKSTLARRVAELSGLPWSVVHGPSVFHATLHDTAAALQRAVAEAERRAPSVLVIDELDTLCGRGAVEKRGAATWMEQQVLALAVGHFVRLRERPAGRAVFVLATVTTSRVADVAPAALECGLFHHTLLLPTPAARERRDLLEHLLASVPAADTRALAAYVAERTHGFVRSDLQSIVLHAAAHAIRRGSAEGVTRSDVDAARRFVQPAALAELRTAVSMRPRVSFAHVAGQAAAVAHLRTAMVLPLTSPDAFARLGVRAPSGVLLHGPSGTGKSLLAEALAAEVSVNFITLSSVDIVSKEVGRTEQQLARVFAQARSAAPCILFIDHVERLAPPLTTDSPPHARRLVGALCAELDAVAGGDMARRVVVLAATTRKAHVYAGLLRAGRLDTAVSVPLPDVAARRAMLAHMAERIPMDESVDLDAMARKASGRSHAELEAMCREAAMRCLRESLAHTAVQASHFVV